MKRGLKGGLIGFVVVFIGLWIFLLATGSDDNGWKCATIEESVYCTFSEFIFSGVNWAFAIFFSLFGLFAGWIDMKIITKLIQNPSQDFSKLPLKITSTIVMSMVIVFGIIGFLAFDDWVATMMYALIFALFAIVVSWLIGKFRYSKPSV